LKLTVEQLERAEAQRLAMIERTLAFFESYDLLLAPATIVPAFPVENRYLAECAGKTFDNYVEWLGIVYAITLTYCPALSLPCGFTASGLPVGLALAAPPLGEAQPLAGDVGDLAGEQPLLCQHDDAVQRGPDLQCEALAQQSDGRRLQRLQHQGEGLHRSSVKLAVL